METPGRADRLRAEILAKVRAFVAVEFGSSEFVPGESPVPCSGRVFDADEVESLVDAALDFWLTSGRFARRFEDEFAQFMEVGHAILTNSGSSANLLALSCLTSPSLRDRRVQPGDEVITAATGFPTTVNPIVQTGLVPVFVDIALPTYNIDVASLEAARSPRTRAVILAHTLGNPFDALAVREFARRHELWLIEDCCDAVGSRLAGQMVGTFGDVATVSFYPAHHITMGEGGCVLTQRPTLRRLVESFRDWGRDCWCEPGVANTCGKRFGWQLGELPAGYDHKYTFTHVGYNLKLTDLQAAVGVAQLQKLPGFIEARRKNFEFLHGALQGLADLVVLPEPTVNSEPSWFGFPVCLRADAPERTRVVAHLEERGIGTRPIFAGNLVRQPAYQDVRYRVAGDLEVSDAVMHRAFWIGLYPGLTKSALAYTVDTLYEALGRSQPCP